MKLDILNVVGEYGPRALKSVVCAELAATPTEQRSAAEKKIRRTKCWARCGSEPLVLGRCFRSSVYIFRIYVGSPPLEKGREATGLFFAKRFPAFRV